MLIVIHKVILFLFYLLEQQQDFFVGTSQEGKSKMDLLKIEFISTSNQIKMVKKQEQHHKNQFRGLNHKFPTKHQIDMPPAEPSIALQMASTWAAAQTDEVLDAAAKREYDAFWGLERFRKNILRKHARNVHLARNFIKGWTFDDIEKNNHEDPDFNAIEILIFQTIDPKEAGDPRDIKQRFEEWVQSGTRHPRTSKKWEKK